MPIISGPAGMDPILGRMRTKDIQGGTASGNYTFNSAEFTVGAAGLVSLNQVPSSKLDTTMDIVNVTGTSVTLQPNTAYKMYATTGALNVTANPPAANKWAYEGHAEIFVGSVGYVVFDTSKIVLANQLEPDSVNNCTLRFHDGMCYVSVEDHIAGYIVVNGSTAGDGSLYYGITTSTNDYVAFDASLNGTTIPLAGATAEGEKHVVGNGYTETAITGAVNCGTSKFTVANIALSDVQVTGGTMTLGNAHIPSGSTLALSGGGLAIEKVTGEGSESVILTSDTIPVGSGSIASASGVRITKSVSSNYGAFYVSTGASLVLHDCECANVSATFRGGIAFVNGTVLMYNCNIHNLGGDAICLAGSNASCYISGCTFDSTGRLRAYQSAGGMQYTFAGSNAFEGAVPTESCTVTLASGAILDLTGNTNATPVTPGGGITFASGGATVLYSSGAVSGSYMMDNVTLPAGAKLTNTAVVDLGDSNVNVPSGSTAIVDGASFTSGQSGRGGAINVSSGASLSLMNVSATGNTASVHGGFAYVNRTPATISGCIVSGNTAAIYAGGLYLISCTVGIDGSIVSGNTGVHCRDIMLHGATVTLAGSTVGQVRFESPGSVALSGTNAVGIIEGFSQTSGSGTVTLTSGAILDLTGNTNATPINPGGGVVVDGGCQVITSAGSIVSIAGGTYTKINNDGTKE